MELPMKSDEINIAQSLCISEVGKPRFKLLRDIIFAVWHAKVTTLYHFPSFSFKVCELAVSTN